VPNAGKPSSAEAGKSWPAIARRIRVPLGFAFAAFYLAVARPTRNSLLWGSSLIIAGLVIRALASANVEKNERLTTTGPYAYTRNPLYLGSLVLAGGFAVAALSVWIVLGMVAIFSAVYIPVILSEESYLRQKFPEFAGYAKHVPRLLPRLTHFRNQPSGFSWSLYWKHREYNATVGAVIMFAALIGKHCWISS